MHDGVGDRARWFTFFFGIFSLRIISGLLITFALFLAFSSLLCLCLFYLINGLQIFKLSFFKLCNKLLSSRFLEHFYFFLYNLFSSNLLLFCQFQLLFIHGNLAFLSFGLLLLILLGLWFSICWDLLSLLFRSICG